MDFDNDGDEDVLSGSWPGELYFFQRNEDGKFEAGKKIADHEGESLNLGKASTVFAADWDGDEDLDLLVGDIQGNVQLVLNEGSKDEPKFNAEDATTIDLGKNRGKKGDSGPVAADWDNDGKVDLVVAFGDGSVYWYRNEGSTEKAKLAAGKQLVGASEFGFDFSKYKPGMWGSRVKVCVTDWDGDGQLDLLLGDRGGEMIESEKDDKPKKVRHGFVHVFLRKTTGKLADVADAK